MQKILLLTISLSACASIDNVRNPNALTANTFKEGLTCITYIGESDRVGMSLAKELEVHFEEAGYMVAVKNIENTEKLQCKHTVKLEPTLFWGTSLGNAYVTLLDMRQNEVSKFKFSNSGRNCCYKGPVAASKDIFKQLVGSSDWF